MNDVSLLMFLFFLGYMQLHYAQSKEVYCVYTPSISNLETVTITQFCVTILNIMQVLGKLLLYNFICT